MSRRRFTSLTAILALVLASLLATPIAAGTAHSHAIGAAVEAVESHGHTHDDVGVAEHDAIDHVHDVPHHQTATIAAADAWQPDWPGYFVDKIEGAIWFSPERPPKPTV